MIKINVSAAPTGYVTSSGSQISTLGKTIYSWGISAQDPGYGQVIECKIGSLHQDSRTFGPLRDRGVDHLFARGSFDVRTTTHLQTDATSSYATRANGAVVRFEAIVNWGMSQSKEILNIPWANNIVGNMRSVLIFNGERALVHTMMWTSRPGVPPYNVSCSWRTFRRDGQRVYLTATSSSSTFMTNVQVEALLAKSPATGGTLTTPTSGVPAYDDFRKYGNESYDSQSAVESAVRAIHGSPGAFSSHPTEFGKLSLDLVKQVRHVDRNILFAVTDTVSFIRDPSSWIEGFRKPLGKLWYVVTKVKRAPGHTNMRDVKSLLRAESNGVLFGAFQVMTTYSDLEQLVRGMVDLFQVPPSRRLHARRTAEVGETTLPGSLPCKHTATLTADVHTWPNDLLGLMTKFVKGLESWGLKPQIQNLWDVIPFSFVIDYVVDLGGYFKWMDDVITLESTFPVNYCVLSEKWEYTLTAAQIFPADVQASGSASVGKYSRWIETAVPVPASPSLSADADGSTYRSVTSTALVLRMTQK